MSGLSMNKSYEVEVSFSDSSTLDYEVEVNYHDDDSMCVPDIDVRVRFRASIGGMGEDFTDEVEDAVNEYFTKDRCKTEEGGYVCFTFNTTTDELTLIEDDDSCASFDDVIEAVKSEISSVSNSDLATIAQQLGLQVEYKGDETFTINRG